MEGLICEDKCVCVCVCVCSGGFSLICSINSPLYSYILSCCVDMRSYMGLVVVLFLTAACTGVLSIPGFQFTVRKLHQVAALVCEGRCAGALQWMKNQKPGGDVVVARCDRTSCSSVDGFTISSEQYLQGNLSLSVTAADYTRRGWYTCYCDGQDLCHVSLRIEPLALIKQVSVGGSVVMEVPVPERVKVMFHRTGEGDGAEGGLSSVSVPLCEVEGRKVQCDAEHEKRVIFKCSLILRAVEEMDRGVYTVQDTDNDETLYTLTLTLTENKTEANNTRPENGNTTRTKQIPPPDGSKHWWVWLLTGIVLGIVLTLVFMHFVIPRIQTCWTRLRAVCFRDEARDEEEEKKQEEEEKKLRDPAENLHLVKRSSSQIHDL